MDINFFEDIVDRRDAEALLIDKEGGSYLTWRATDAAYYLSYMSASSRQVTHIDITRDPNGEFYLKHGLNQKRYPDLGILLQERGYISKPVRTSADGGPTVDTSASPSQVTQTTSGRAKAQAAKSSLPNYIEPPKAKIDDRNEADDDFLDSNKYSRGIRPSLSPTLLYAIFAACGTIAAFAVAAGWMQKRSKEADALSTASDMHKVASSAVQGASMALFDRLHALDPGAMPDNGPTLEQQCVSAVQDWKAELEPIVPVLQHMYDSAHITAYLSTLVYSCLLCALLALTLGCVHTGRTRKRYTPTEQDFMASGTTGGGREPLCTQLQSAWSGAWLSLLASTLLCGFWLVNVLWELGAAGTSVQYAAQTLSTMFPSDVRAQTGSASNVRALYATALERGMWGSVAVLSGVPASCMAAMQPVIKEAVEMPALVRMGTVPTWLKIVLAPAFRPQPSAAPSTLGAWEPLAWPAMLHGWMDERGSIGTGLGGRVMQWVMPSQKAVAISTLNSIAVFMALSIALLVVQEWCVGEAMPAYRRWQKTGHWRLEKAVQARLAGKTTSIKVAGKDD